MMNYFELFKLPVAPSVDKSSLAKRYFELQRLNHPDFFSQGTEAEKELAMEQSAAINKAFVTFQNELSTIEYFLTLKGSIYPDEKFSLPPDFLMDMMELNEMIGVEDIGAVQKAVATAAAALDTEISPVISEYNPAADDPAVFDRLKAYFFKKKYLKRILDRLSD